MKSYKTWLTESVLSSKWLRPLMRQSLLYDSFEKFSKAYSLDAIRGIYYHFTDNENFKIDKNLGPRDMSSMASGKMSAGSLMVTSHFDNWYEDYKEEGRKYVALIDCSKIKMSQVGRTYGNEFFIHEPEKCEVLKVMTLNEGKRFDTKFNNIIPGSKAELLELYEKARD